jgi:conjugative relaxase-like TrwC/TraI family protein
MRMRKGKKAWTEEVQHTGVLCSARFEHDASRALDAQLHTHLVTVNATFCSESGEWYALTESEILRAIRYLGKVYQNSLARRVMNCGYYLEDTSDEGGQVIR